MHMTQHNIEVSADVQTAFSLCRDVEQWPQIFPPCEKVTLIQFDGHLQEFEITAYAHGTPHTWRSKRTLHPDINLITFSQVKTPPMIERMEGTWRFFPTENGTLISLEHRFDMRVQDGDTSSNDDGESLQRVLSAIDENSRVELESIRSVLGNRNSLMTRNQLLGNMNGDAVFEEVMTVKANVEQVYYALWRANEWPTLLPYCRSVVMHYDDGYNQELTMELEVDGHVESIRSIRRGVRYESIQYFQPSPPLVLKSHVGEWSLVSTSNGTEIHARHAIVIDKEVLARDWGKATIGDAIERVKHAINTNSVATMGNVKRVLEKNTEELSTNT
jgi:aromatase